MHWSVPIMVDLARSLKLFTYSRYLVFVRYHTRQINLQHSSLPGSLRSRHLPERFV